MPARGWQTAVVASAAIVVLAALSIGIGWAVTLHSRVATYSVSAPLSRVELTMSSGQAVIVGTQSATLQVRRTEHYAFGRVARESRSLMRGVLRISSRCPKIVVGSCSDSYELAVPETVTVSVRTSDGDVRLTGFRGTANVQTSAGNVDVEAYCGFDLSARTGSGDVRIAAACSPEHLQVLTRSGNILAQVPPARYRISASSGAGEARVNGVISDSSAPFTIDTHSGTGRVAIGGGL
jgi:hypothetical protein